VLRRWAGVLACVLVLAAGACRAGGNDSAGDVGDAFDGDDTTATTGGANGTSPSSTQQGGGGTATTGRGGTTTTNRGGGTGTTARPSGDTDPTAKGGVGAYARSVLRPAPATKVVLEVMQQSGVQPTQRSLDHAVSVLRQVTGKPVSLSGPIDIPGDRANHTTAQILDMSDRYAKAPQNTGQAVVRILFLAGSYNGDQDILGVALRGDTAAVMVDRVRSSASPLAPRAVIEDAVTMHELGHLLGLVGIAVNPGRADPEHAGHSTNRDSVMYWAVESSLVGQVLGGPPPVDFDNADRADLAAMRNGG
jgi:hypothetical protein